MFLAAVVFSFVACAEHSDPTDPSAPKAADVKTVAIQLPDSNLEVGLVTHAIATPMNGAGEAVQPAAVEWSSSDTSVFVVSSGGEVRARKTGAASVSAMYHGVRGLRTLTVIDTTPAKVVITPGAAGIRAGTHVQLSASVATITGRVLTGHPVTWKSTDPRYVTVSATGLATGVTMGSAHVIALASRAADTAVVKISAASIAALSITPATSTLAVNQRAQLSAKATDASGRTLVGRTIGWKSMNTSVATVSTSGVVTARTIGDATILASGGDLRAHATIHVGSSAVSSVTVSPASVSLVAGATRQLAAKLLTNSGTTITAQSITWSSSNSAVVKVSSTGLATAAHVGTATVTATANGKSGRTSFTVTAGPVSALAITPATRTVQDGKTLQLAVSFTDVAGNSVNGGTVTWASSNRAVATISSSGLVTGVAAGTTNITATASGKSKTVAITVTSSTQSTATLTSLTLSPQTATLAPNSTSRFAVSGRWSDGSTTAPTATYTATGGTISSTGVYTAGSTSGTFRVIATQTGHSLADTAIITITGSVASTACSATPHTRLVSVASSTQLRSAITDAKPGDLIDMADGTYGGVSITASGTASARITLCGSAGAVINTGSNSSMPGINAVGANYWTFSGFTITNALFGIYAQKSSHVLVQGLTMHAIGQEAIEIFNFSKYAVIRGNRIYDTGTRIAEYGEGVYIGSSFEKWSTFTGGQPDHSDSSVVDGNTFGPNVRAEAVDVKEGTVGGQITNNAFDGTGMVESEAGWPTSWVIIQGNNYHISGNRGKNTIVSGYRATFHGTVGTGSGNVFSGNTADVGGAPYGFAIDAPPSNGNVVRCDNVVLNAAKGFATVQCQ